MAELSKEKLAKSGVFKNPIATKILEFKIFYNAEDYHQDYYKKIPFVTNFTGQGLAATNLLMRHGREKRIKQAN